jgi:hypothetical protein
MSEPNLKKEKMPIRKNNSIETADPVVKRLDCLIRLFSEALKATDKKSFNDGHISRLLNSSGLTPTEIARILGKKSASDISPYLYIKKK